MNFASRLEMYNKHVRFSMLKIQYNTVLTQIQHCIGQIIMGCSMIPSSMDRGNQYIQLVKVLYCTIPLTSLSKYQLSHIGPVV